MPDERADRLNWVPKLNPMGGAGLWMRSTEVKTQAACGRCGGSIKSHTEVCLACLRVSKRNQIRLDRQRSAPLKKKSAPKSKLATEPADAKGGLSTEKMTLEGRDNVTGPGKVLTRKERRWAIRKAKNMPEGQAWLRSIGLIPADS